MAAMRDEACLVVENRQLSRQYFLLKVRAEYISRNAKPGNFVMVRIMSEVMVPLLRRPFAILKSEPPYIWLYYEVVGHGTSLLSSLREGDDLIVLGPLGNAFPEYRGKRILLIAGGRGIAPLLYAARDQAVQNEVFLSYGARAGADLNLLTELKQIGMKQQFIYTEDGTRGEKGLVTGHLREIIQQHHIDVTFSCGPEAMYEELARSLAGLNCENWVSLEAIMGCGFGICHSCAVRTQEKVYKKVCSDGPIFKLEEIDWQTFR